ncbi:hypothetical protein GGR52DRAFT_153372 [Hypoxylon sp. FL1284]|nr:hypothetical protein GGR52DRAFT_153372 [Hypoxylon sp. FL1284]
MFAPTFRRLFAGLPTTRSLSSRPLCSAPAPSSRAAVAASPIASLRSIHTTPPRDARAPGPKGNKGSGGKGGGKKKKRKKGKGQGPDARIKNLKSSMPRAVPAPLRFARNRALRHWTIHRAWLLFQRKEREREEHELERMYQSMHNACEELRKTSGPGTRNEGYLYRAAMEKKGLYGHNSIPIEYSRWQTETPAREPWDHDWTR